MSKKTSSPLVDVAMSYVREENQDLNHEETKYIRLVFENFVDEAISYEKASFELKKHLKSLNPLHKIYSILNITHVNQMPLLQTVNLNNMNDISNSLTINPLSECQSTSAIKNRQKTRSWSIEEDQRLLMGVHLYGLENWNHVADFVGNKRTRSMCSQRWLRVLDPKISKNQWTDEENKTLLHLINTYGTKSWMKIATKLGNRSDVQCRYQFKQLMKEIKDNLHSSNQLSLPKMDSKQLDSIKTAENVENPLLNENPSNINSSPEKSSVLNHVFSDLESKSPYKTFSTKANNDNNSPLLPKIFNANEPSAKNENKDDQNNLFCFEEFATIDDSLFWSNQDSTFSYYF